MTLKNLTKTIEHKWRVQSFSKNKPSAQIVAYIDARDVMDLLDDVCGAENWQDDYKDINGKLFAGIGIKFNEKWIWKWDIGSESDIEKDKGNVSDAFKRAGVKWGIGRFLYRMQIKYMKTNTVKTPLNRPYIIDDNGKQIWDLNKYINLIKK